MDDPGEGSSNKTKANVSNEGESHEGIETETAKDEPDKGDSIRINIEEVGQQSGDSDIQTDRGTYSNGMIKRKLDEIISLGDDLLKVERYNIKPKRSVWVFRIEDEAFGDLLDYDNGSRNDFLLKVLTLVFIMLITTAGIAGVILFEPSLAEVKHLMANEEAFLFLMGWCILALVMMNYVVFCSDCSRVPPCNFICLIITVVLCSICITVFILRFNAGLVVIATIFVMAGTVFFGILLACTGFDFTRYILFAFVITIAIGMVAGIVIVLSHLSDLDLKPMQIAILVLSTLFSVISLTMEMQMVIGGESIEVGENDYGLAAFMLYTAIIQLFVQILRILGSAIGIF